MAGYALGSSGARSRLILGEHHYEARYFLRIHRGAVHYDGVGRANQRRSGAALVAAVAFVDFFERALQIDRVPFLLMFAPAAFGADFG